MSENAFLMPYFYESSLSNESRVTDNAPKSLQNEILLTAKLGEYSSLLHIYAVCNAICMPIRSIFPEVINAAISRDCHNQLIKPFRDYDVSLNDISVMWTHASNSV